MLQRSHPGELRGSARRPHLDLGVSWSLVLWPKASSGFPVCSFQWSACILLLRNRITSQIFLMGAFLPSLFPHHTHTPAVCNSSFLLEDCGGCAESVTGEPRSFSLHILGVREGPLDPAADMQTQRKPSTSAKFTQRFSSLPRWCLMCSPTFFLPCWGSACSLGLP